MCKENGTFPSLSPEGNKPVVFSKLSYEDIIEIAENFARRFQFKAGGSLRSIVERLSGRIEYVAPHKMTDKARLQLTPTSDTLFTISLSSLLSPLQERVSIAHELGHYVLHSVFGKNKDIFTQENYNNYANRMELEADLFAEALLMPKDAVQNFDSLIELASYFKVPISVAKVWAQYVNNNFSLDRS